MKRGKALAVKLLSGGLLADKLLRLIGEKFLYRFGVR